jgi:hypothetical protein
MMKSRWSFTGILFALTAVLMLYCGFHYSTVIADINIHDTYYITPLSTIGTRLCLFLLGIAVLYFTFRMKKIPLKRWMNVLHFVFTALAILGTTYILYCSSLYGNFSRMHMSEEMSRQGVINAATLGAFLLGIIGQVFFVLNISIALVAKMNSKQ